MNTSWSAWIHVTQQQPWLIHQRWPTSIVRVCSLNGISPSRQHRGLWICGWYCSKTLLNDAIHYISSNYMKLQFGVHPMFEQTQNRDGAVKHVVESRANWATIWQDLSLPGERTLIASSLKTFSHFTWDVRCNKQLEKEHPKTHSLW